MKLHAITLTLSLLAAACGEDEPPLPARPAVADPADWCAEHAVPESMCTLCNRSLVARYQAAGDYCAAHGFPESVCPDCHPLAPPAGVATAPEHHGGEGEEHEGEEADEAPFEPGTRIRFRSVELEDAAGIAVVDAASAALGVGVEATAHIDYDRNRYAEVTAQVPGIVREVHVDLGEVVAAGQVLFTLESVQVGDLQARLGAARERASAAQSNLQRQEALGDVASQRAIELARQEREAAQSEVRAIESSLRMAGRARAGGRYGLVAPMAGTVVRRPGVVGAHATAEEPLAVIADTSRMWALLEVRDSDAGAIRVGQPVSIEVRGVHGRRFEGEITWIASEVDPRTRTVAARAEIASPDGVLRANHFGRARIQVASEDRVVTVPRDAVQRVGDAHVVFVRLNEGLYEPRAVELGRSGEGVVQVRGEVEPGAPIVTRGAYLLKTELMRDRIGAGCCEVE